MCLILFAHQVHPNYRLVLAANRDELFARPTQQANFWRDESQSTEVLAGRDLQAGGTWLGLSKSGRFAAVTNIRDPSRTEKKLKSRGELTLNFLKQNESAKDYAESLAEQFDQFAGYNLLIGDESALYYVNNFEKIIKLLEPGYYGLSNGVLNGSWPKITNGKIALKQLLESDAELTTDALINIMASKVQAPDTQLPDTGIPIELERTLSSMFIENPERQYGTLCSTALITNVNGETRFSEQNYSSLSLRTQGHFYEFRTVL
ncbi:MAG: hypothetical protein ACJA2Q_002760 [Pseudohongiellaceae bacterium]|jgi:uncharacterized protein with NRDE domain